MNSDGRTTSEQLYIPTLLVVGGCEALVVRCYHAARTTGLAIRRCDLEEAAVTVPRRHPLAIVVPNDVFDTAAQELAALARDVRSILLRVDSEVSVRELEAMIAGAVADGLSQRERRGGAGRYSITDGIQEEAPFSRREGRQSFPGEVRQSSPPEARQSVPFDARQSLPRSGPSSARVPGLASIRPVPGPVSTRPSVTPGPMSSRPSATTPPVSTRPPSTPAPMSSRPSVTPASGSGRPSPVPPPVSGRVSVQVPVPAGSSEPPVSGPPSALEGPRSASGPQRTPSGHFAAIRTVFSSR